MSAPHLTEDEFDLILADEPHSGVLDEHLGSCLVCRRRVAEFKSAVAAARAGDPDPAVREALRQRALDRWDDAKGQRTGWWLAAAAAVLLALLLPSLHKQSVPTAAVDTDAVLRDVDAVLARDPLSALASEDVLQAVVPENPRERSLS